MFFYRKVIHFKHCHKARRQSERAREVKQITAIKQFNNRFVIQHRAATPFSTSYSLLFPARNQFWYSSRRRKTRLEDFPVKLIHICICLCLLCVLNFFIRFNNKRSLSKQKSFLVDVSLDGGGKVNSKAS